MTPPRHAGTDRHRVLAVESRRALLDALRRSPGALDAAQLATQVGLHVTTAREHLELLVRDGSVSRETERRTVRGRPRVLYTATSRREPDDGDGLLAMMLASHLAQGDDPRGQAEEAGRRWGRRALVGGDVTVAAGTSTSEPGGRITDVGAATRRVVSLLAEVGFEPTERPVHGGTEIDLHRCPFVHTAQTHPEVACSVHLGLMRGALESMGAPVHADRLEPFVTATLCRAHLSAD